jgi:predicted GIY-YIG superfamily endonuclease
MNADDRVFFVYRVYDVSGKLLYIGCTNRPYIRWAEHRAERPVMATRAARFRMAGPYTRAVARQLEREALRTEHPFFGMTPAKHSAISQAHAWEARRTSELLKSGWDYTAAWKLAAAEVKQQFPGAPTSYADVTRAMQRDVRP